VCGGVAEGKQLKKKKLKKSERAQPKPPFFCAPSFLVRS
jgi:hypothetical protein